MTTTDALAYVRAIASQRNIAREVMMNEIMSICAKLKKNSYSRTEMEHWGDGRLCLILEVHEQLWEEHVELNKRNEKLKSQNMGPVYVMLALMVAMCFAGCSKKSYPGQAHKHPVEKTYTHPCVKWL